jgi:hypothetical protein
MIDLRIDLRIDIPSDIIIGNGEGKDDIEYAG